ncbi:MAG: hypothetical protein Q8K70_00660 [Bacteroidota bacterium]|nr:hypothetical protein [Bacteroidota bacterium]
MKYFFTSIIVLMFFSACRKENAETLYPDNSNCDTSNMTYSTHISPILKSNCALSGCHNSASKSAGYAYETYNEIKASVNNGRLMGSIRHLSGFSNMPKGGSKLSDCNINKIQAWINKGALDN